MADNIKPTSFRISEDAAEKFKKFASTHNMNQAEAFDSLVNTYETALAKEQIQGRATEIETFQTTVNNLMRMFLNSLAVNQTTEDRIREQLSVEIHTKEQTIFDLQSERDTLKASIEKLTTKLKDLNEAASKNIKTIEKLERDLEAKSNQVETYESQMKTLNSIIDEYKGFKESNIELEKVHKELKKINSDLENENKKLNGALENNKEMIVFYKEQLDNYKSDIKDLNAQSQSSENAHRKELDTLGDKYSKEIKELNTEHKKALEVMEKKYSSQIKELNSTYKNNMDALEKRYTAEIETLKSTYAEEINTLKNSITKDNKTALEKRKQLKKEKGI